MTDDLRGTRGPERDASHEREQADAADAAVAAIAAVARSVANPRRVRR